MPCRTLLALVVALLWVAAPALAETRPAPKPSAEGRREVKIRADRMDYDEARKQVRLIGHVRFESGDTVMTSAYAQYQTEKQVAEFQGGVRLTQPGSTLVGNRMKVWYGEQRGVLVGSVRLVTEKAPGGESRTPAVMICNELEYRWVEGIGEARGAVKVRQGERRAFADRAHYDRKADTIDLLGNVRFEQGKEDWLTSESAQVNLATETIAAKGRVVGRFLVDQEEKAPAPPAGPSLPVPGALEPPIPLKPAEASPPVSLPGLGE